MAKVDKVAMNRMEGMIFAYNVGKKAAEEKGEPLGAGLLAIKEDIKKRGFFKAPMKFVQKQIDEWIDYLSKNLYNTMLAVVLMTLHDEFGFGKERIRRFKKVYNEKTLLATDFNYLGKTHTTLGDYVKWLNEKYDYLELDLERVEECQKSYTEGHILKGKADIKEVIEMLRRQNEMTAADLLEEWSSAA